MDYLITCVLSHSVLFDSLRPHGSHQVPLSGILQARILKWVAMPSSKGSSQTGDQTHVPHVVGEFFTV